MKPKIIGFARSNFVRTVRMVAHEKGIAYDHAQARPHSPEVKAIHPLGQVPALEHDGLVIAESLAIAIYLDNVFPGPRMVPEDPRAAAPVMQWASLVATSVDRLFMRQYVVQYVFNHDDKGNVIRDEIDKAVPRMPRLFGKLDAAVGEGFLAGSAFSLADCFLMPILAVVQLFPEGAEGLKAAPNLAAYFERLSERPSFAETAPSE